MKKSRTTKHILCLSAWSAILSLGLSAQAQTIYQTASMSVGKSWLDADFWSNTNAPTAGNDYVNANDNNGTGTTAWTTRTPGGSESHTFGGDSLTLTNGGFITLKGTGTYTFNSLSVWSDGVRDGKISNGGANGAIIDGALFLKGTGTATLDSQGPNRLTTISATVTVDAGIDTIDLAMNQTPTTVPAYTSSGFTLTNPANSFDGLWNVQHGLLKGFLGNGGSFYVDTTAYLDPDADYTGEVLTIQPGGMILLDQNITMDECFVNLEQMGAKTWSGAELKVHPVYSNAFDTASLDNATLTVLSGPPPLPTETQYLTADMPAGTDWNDAGYWTNTETPSQAYFYANDTSGWVLQTPVASDIFGGYDLTIENGGILNLQGAATYTVDGLKLGGGSKITRGTTGAATLNGTLDLTGSGTVTFSALATNALSTIASFITTSNSSIDTIAIDVEENSTSNTAVKANSGFIFSKESDFTGLWKVEAGMLKGIGFGSGSFLVTDMGRLDFDETYFNLGADLTIEMSSNTNIGDGTMILDQTVTVGSATIWGETLAPGLYSGADLKAHPVFGTDTNGNGGAFSGNKTLDTAVLAVGVAPPVFQTKSQPTGLGWNDPTSWDNGLAPTNIFDYICDRALDFRSANVAGPVFGGRSITLMNGARLKSRHSGYATITNFTMHAGCEIRAVTGTGFAGDLALVGEGGITCNTEIPTRKLEMASLITADESFTNITITCNGFTAGAETATGFTFSNPSNTFAGTWNIEKGYLKGEGLAQGSFIVGVNGFLQPGAEYVNTNADLTVVINPTNSAAGGQIQLDHDMTANKVVLWGVELAIGTYTSAELRSHPVYGGAIHPLSSGSLTVTFIPVIPEIGTLTYSIEGSDLILGWAEGSKYATYTLQSDNNLAIAPDWTDIVDIPGVDGPMSVTNTISGDPQTFYRVIGN
ncbi:hypothetical protein P4C99_11730 [Pontiellaceae bacterium B1224]|nr:hypothetical protein [Pontiellaceae bacterium B1224]